MYGIGFKVAVTIIGIALLALTVYLMEWKKWTLDKSYPIVAGVFCFLYMFVIPVFHAPDEMVHFLGANLTANQPTLSTIAYWPSAFFIWIGHMFSATDEALGYLGTIANIVVFIAASSYAIHKIPFGKRTLFIISLLPITLQQVASLSYDSAIISSVFVITTLSLRWKFAPNPKIPHKRMTLGGRVIITNRVTGWERLWYLIASCVLLFTKHGSYAVLILFPVVLYINKSWFRGKKLWLWLAGLIAAIYAFYVWFWKNLGVITVMGFFLQTPYVEELNAYCTPVMWYLEHPASLLEILTTSIKSDGLGYIYQMFGGVLGSMNVFTWKPGVYLLMLVFVLSLIRRDYEHRYITIPRRIFLTVFALVPDVVAILAMLFYWTPAGSGIILGMQGRYFLPSLFALSVGIGYWRKPVIHSDFMQRHGDCIFATVTILLVTIMSTSAVQMHVW